MHIHAFFRSPFNKCHHPAPPLCKQNVKKIIPEGINGRAARSIYIYIPQWCMTERQKIGSDMKTSGKKKMSDLLNNFCVGMFGAVLFMVTALDGPLIVTICAWAFAIAITGLSFSIVRVVDRLAARSVKDVVPAPLVRQVAHASGITPKQ